MPYLSKPRGQALEHLQERPGGPLELDNLTGQVVDAPGHFGVAAENLGLDLVDVVLQSGHDRRVAVDDGVHDRVENRFGTQSQQVRVVFHAPSHGREIRRLAVPYGQHEVRADEDVQFAELHLLGLILVASRPQHHEKRVAVTLQLRPLVRGDRVLHRQLVQPELLGGGHHLCLGRPVETDPRHAARLVGQHLIRVREGRRRIGPLAVEIDSAVDHALLDRRTAPLVGWLQLMLGRERMRTVGRVRDRLGFLGQQHAQAISHHRNAFFAVTRDGDYADRISGSFRGQGKSPRVCEEMCRAVSATTRRLTRHDEPHLLILERHWSRRFWPGGPGKHTATE